MGRGTGFPDEMVYLAGKSKHTFVFFFQYTFIFINTCWSSNKFSGQRSKNLSPWVTSTTFLSLSCHHWLCSRLWAEYRSISCLGSGPGVCRLLSFLVLWSSGRPGGHRGCGGRGDRGGGLHEGLPSHTPPNNMKKSIPTKNINPQQFRTLFLLGWKIFDESQNRLSHCCCACCDGKVSGWLFEADLQVRPWLCESVLLQYGNRKPPSLSTK